MKKIFLGWGLSLFLAWAFTLPGFAAEVEVTGDLQLKNNLWDPANRVIYNAATNLVMENRLPCDVCTERNAAQDKCVPLADNTQDNTEKFGRTCNANCMKCYQGQCVYQGNGEDLFNHCIDYNCASLVYGWDAANKTNCHRYNESSALNANGYCNGFGACRPNNAENCVGETEGAVLAACGSEGCCKACPSGGLITDYDSVAEVCYTDSARHNCPFGYICNATGHCVGNLKLRVFVTSGTHNGNFNEGGIGGLNGMDLFCQNHANSAGMGTNWVAWASTATVNARDRIKDAVAGYYLTDNSTKVANNKADLLDGSLLMPINKDQNFQGTIGFVWTGTKINGTNTAGYCNNWTHAYATSPYGNQGNSQQVNAMWTDSPWAYCNSMRRVYCFEN